MSKKIKTEEEEEDTPAISYMDLYHDTVPLYRRLVKLLDTYGMTDDLKVLVHEFVVASEELDVVKFEKEIESLKEHLNNK